MRVVMSAEAAVVLGEEGGRGGESHSEGGVVEDQTTDVFQLFSKKT